MLWVGVQCSEDRKENFFFAKLSFQREHFSLKNFWKVCNKGSMGQKKMRVIETCISKTISMERFFDEKVFLKDIVVSGSTEDPLLKKKLYFGEIIFFSLLFPSNKIDSFDIIHQWGTQNWCYKQK